MSNITGTIRAKATIEASGIPVIYNITLDIAGTEYSQALPVNTKQFLIKSRTNSIIKLAFSSGDTSVLFITVPPGCTYCAEGLNFSGTIYVQAPTASQIVEILAWS